MQGWRSLISSCGRVRVPRPLPKLIALRDRGSCMFDPCAQEFRVCNCGTIALSMLFKIGTARSLLDGAGRPSQNREFDSLIVSICKRCANVSQKVVQPVTRTQCDGLRGLEFTKLGSPRRPSESEVICLRAACVLTFKCLRSGLTPFT